MNLTTAFLSIYLLLTGGNASAASLRSSLSDQTGVKANFHRDLQADGMKDFLPLSCNANLASATCKTWSSTFGASSSHSSRITIPCGQCVVMDHIGGSMQLLGGLDIIGKLVFPDGFKLNLSSSAIIVQGELQMTSSKPIDGSPDVKITMIGDDNALTFTPVDTNANACKGLTTCSAGKKAIIVAGGKVTLRGIPANTPTWTRLYDAIGGTFNNPTTILVSNTVKGKWAAGAQIVITSHTRDWDQHQERTIVQVADSSVSGYVALTLNAAIVRPTTLLESADFAVEVALLSRNILFEGGADATVSHGGHFMIMHTPTVIQIVEGIDFQNFGQQGSLGRYPIHFHFCSNVPGSIVSKNTIRRSNQRCVVVHGTNKLRIEENVAYDTKGHCYMTEDGIETGNEFIRNLGAKTAAPATIIPNMGTNGDESDSEPATFWITNPTNSWLGNVAAGSFDSGFWFDPQIRGTRAYLFPNYDPQIELLVLFKDNVAHSNVGKLGAVRTYTPGYRPKGMVTFDGIKAYRNQNMGIHIHRCENIIVANSLFADNSIGVDLDRAQGIEVTNVQIIGESDSYKQLRLRQAVGSVCLRNRVIGIDLHTWKTDKEWAGAKMTNVDISGFGTVGSCTGPSSLSFDDHTLKQGLFEFYTSFKGTNLRDGAERVNMCLVNDAEFKMIYIVDLDGTMKPKSVASAGLSTLVASDNRELLRFADATKCTDVAAGCYQYCADTCFRSVRYEVTGTGQATYQLKVCLKNDRTKCSVFAGGRRGDSGEHTFIAHLPAGNSYDAVFLDSTGKEITPLTLVGTYEESFCATNSIFDVTIYGKLPNVTPVAPAPIAPPVTAPVSAPFFIPVPAPVSVPVKAPVSIPVAVPVPVKAPVSIPVAVPVPVKAPVFFPVAAPVQAPIPSSVFTGLFLIQTKTGTESVLPSTINRSTSGTSLSIVAKTSGTSVVKVNFWFDGKLVRSETSAPWALNGDRSGKYTAYTPLANPGSHTVQVEAFAKNGSSLGKSSMTFTVI